eukprot:jgi/Ulvmu1/11224/UM072_0061.1
MRLWSLTMFVAAACWAAAAVAAVDLKGYTLLPRHATDEQRASISVIVSNVKGLKKKTYCRPDGGFTVYGLEEGDYMIDVAIIGWTFPQYNLKVSSKYHDGVRVTPLNSRVPLEPTVILAPLSEANYFAKRKAIDIRSYLFSPYGLMMVFGLFALVVAPNMKVDPEEMAKMQEEMKDSPFSFLMGGPPQQPSGTTSTAAAVTAAGTSATMATASSSKRGGKRR